MELHHERILKILFVLIWALALIHMTAEYYYLYWTIRWFDVLTHFLGGVWVGLATIWFWYFSGYLTKARMPRGSVFLAALCGGLVIGVLWEAYEFIVWMWSERGLPLNYVGDTSLDLVMDILGSSVGFMVYKLSTRTLETQEV